MKNESSTLGKVCKLLALCGFIGCSDRTVVRELPLSVIDGREITVADVSNTVMVVSRIQTLAKRPIREKQFPVWANRYALQMTPGLMQAALFERAVAERGVRATGESDAATLAKYNRMTRQKAASLEELAPLFGELEPTFRRQFMRESAFEAFYLGSGCDQVSDRDLASYYRMQTNLLNRCRRITELGWKRGREAHAKLEAGESWEVVAKAFTEDGAIEPTNADNWQDWISLPLNKIESKELADAVGKLEIGGYTEPIDIDEGLVIVRLNGKDGDLFELSRILIRLGREMEIPGREDALREIRRNKRMELQASVLEEARAKFKVEYPRGTNFVLRIWDVPQGKSRKPPFKLKPVNNARGESK